MKLKSLACLLAGICSLALPNANLSAKPNAHHHQRLVINLYGNNGGEASQQGQQSDSNQDHYDPNTNTSSQDDYKQVDDAHDTQSDQKNIDR